MSGTLKVGGKTLATHDTNSNVAKIQLGSTSDVVLTDSAGNNVLSESGGVVTLTADTAVIEGSSSGDLVRITQTGTGNALVVEDSTNPDSTPFVVDSSGNVLIGTTSTDQASSIGSKFVSNGRLYQVSSHDSNSQENLTMYSTGASAFRFYVDWGGTIHATNTTVSAISDQRFKENIRDLDVGLDAIMQLKPRKFDWKEGKGKNIQNDRGFIAQEFGKVFPDLIDEWKDPAPEGEEPYKSVRQDLIPVLVKAIQEQQTFIESQQSQIDALTARIEALEATP